MTDGNTAIQVSPAPTEEDMSKVRSIFDQALNAIVGMSALAAQVEVMQGELNSFKSEIDYVKERNRSLDEMLASVRKQRDEAQGELSVTNDVFNRTLNDLDIANRTLNERANEIDGLRTEIAGLEDERDTWSNEWTKASDDLSKAREVIAKFEELLEPFRAKPEPDKIPETTYDSSTMPGPVEPPTVDTTKPYHWEPALARYINS